MKNSTYIKYNIYKSCTALFIIIAMLVVVSATYPEYFNKDLIGTNNNNFESDKTSGELSNKGYSNMGVDFPESRYSYTIKKVSDNRIEYHRYMPQECIISINSESITKTGNCNDNDLFILEEEGY